MLQDFRNVIARLRVATGLATQTELQTKENPPIGGFSCFWRHVRRYLIFDSLYVDVLCARRIVISWSPSLSGCRRLFFIVV